LIKNSQPFGKKFQKTAGGIFLTHTVYNFEIRMKAARKNVNLFSSHRCCARMNPAIEISWWSPDCSLYMDAKIRPIWLQQ